MTVCEVYGNGYDEAAREPTRGLGLGLEVPQPGGPVTPEPSPPVEPQPSPPVEPEPSPPVEPDPGAPDVPSTDPKGPETTAA